MQPRPTPPEVIIQSFCMSLSNHCGFLWAGISLTPRASVLLDNAAPLHYPDNLTSDKVAIIARAPVPAGDGSSWGEMMLGDLAAKPADAASAALLQAVGVALGRLLDRTAARTGLLQKA